MLEDKANALGIRDNVIFAGSRSDANELLSAMDEDTRVRVASAGSGVTLTPEKQAVIDKILMATPEQFSQIKVYVDFVMQ